MNSRRRDNEILIIALIKFYYLSVPYLSAHLCVLELNVKTEQENHKKSEIHSQVGNKTPSLVKCIVLHVSN